MAKNEPLGSGADAERKADNFNDLIRKLAKLSGWPKIEVPPFKIPNWPSGYAKVMDLGDRKITFPKAKNNFLELEVLFRNIAVQLTTDGSIIFDIDGEATKDRYGNATNKEFSTSSGDLYVRLVAIMLLFQLQEDIIARLTESIDEHFNSLDIIRNILKPYAPAMVAEQLSK